MHSFKIARILAGYTQQGLASQLGVSQQTVAKWEAGINTPREMKTVRAIEALLQHDKRELFPDVFGDCDGGRIGGIVKDK